MRSGHRLSRREFVQGSLVAAGALVLGGYGILEKVQFNKRDYGQQRSDILTAFSFLLIGWRIMNFQVIYGSKTSGVLSE